MQKTYRFRGKVLSDGHLSIPDEVAQVIGKEFEVIMKPIDDIKNLISLYLDGRLEKKGKLKELSLDSEKIEEALKNAFGTADIGAIMEAVRK